MPRRSTRGGLLILLILALALAATGCQQPAAPAASGPGALPGTIPADQIADQIMTVDQLRPGMKGYGLTVFAGAHPERFDVEVLSVVRNWDPQSDVILVKCAGHNLDVSGIVAGMSGSPVYINGKLIGAVAYGWSFSKEAVGGVQPIAQMLRNSGMHQEVPPDKQEILPQGAVASSARRPAWLVDGRKPDRLAPRRDAGSGEVRAASGLAGEPPRLRPLATPLMVSGGSEQAMALLRQKLSGSGFVAVRSGGASGEDPRMADAKLAAGTTITIPLMSGDMDISALGTVTAVVGDRVLAFGHPMFGEGPVNLPMATGIVHTFISSYDSSFKMGSAGPVVGAVRRDESFSILGVKEQVPYMSPVTVKVRSWTGDEKTYHYKIADEWYFSPRMAMLALYSSVTADHGEPRDQTLYYSGTIRFKGFEPYRFKGVTTSAYEAAYKVAMPIDAMLNNMWGKGLVESIDLDVEVVNEDRSGGLERARLENSTLAPGEDAVIYLTMRRYRKPKVERTLRVKLPADLPDGSYRLMLLDAEDYGDLVMSHNPRLFRPENMTEMLATFTEMAQPQNDTYYVVLTLPEGGLVSRDQRFPELPGSRVLMLQQAGRYDLMPFQKDRVWPESMGMPVMGSTAFQITVDRDKDKRL
ncbi:MAG: hypothetical protein BIFFINMI_02357 [Phycisphaerae bacterium]|nr:hypothetical protein [Phycisphaerae bacterium]